MIHGEGGLGITCPTCKNFYPVNSGHDCNTSETKTSGLTILTEEQKLIAQMAASIYVGFCNSTHGIFKNESIVGHSIEAAQFVLKHVKQLPSQQTEPEPEQKIELTRTKLKEALQRVQNFFHKNNLLNKIEPVDPKLENKIAEELGFKE
jgi:hypothetical protein